MRKFDPSTYEGTWAKAVPNLEHTGRADLAIPTLNIEYQVRGQGAPFLQSSVRPNQGLTHNQPVEGQTLYHWTNKQVE